MTGFKPQVKMFTLLGVDTHYDTKITNYVLDESSAGVININDGFRLTIPTANNTR